MDEIAGHAEIAVRFLPELRETVEAAFEVDYEARLGNGFGGSS